MKLLASLVIGLVAVSHFGFLALEMFFWTKPVGMAVFGSTPEFAAQSAVLAANQGLYNGFLATGLLWGLLAGRMDIKIFFLSCIVVAGVFGGITASVSIVFVQALPAAIALGLLWGARRELNHAVA